MSKTSRLFILTLILLVTSIALVPAQAATTMLVASVWRPAYQLTSLDTNGSAYPTYDADDDYRYVDLDIYATVDDYYWTTQITCTVPPAILDSYTWDDPSGGSYPLTDDTGDDTRMVTWGPLWGNSNQYQEVVEPFDTTTGTIRLTISKYGDGWSMGGSGVNHVSTELLTTIRFRVKPQAIDPFIAQVSPKCTALFLDLDGKSVGKPKYSKITPLEVMSGYTIQGNVYYQAAPTSALGIDIVCAFDPLGAGITFTTTTDKDGNFAITNLRNLGDYDCYFYGQVLNPGLGESTHLTAETWLYLNQYSHTLLPTRLRSGNVSATVGMGERIDVNDVVTITTSWQTTVASPFAGGDVNGDTRVNESDLAIVTSNYGQIEAVNAEHWLFGMNREDNLGPNRIGFTNVDDKRFTEWSKTKVPQYWPTLSPDGSKIAFVQPEKDGTYALYVQNSDASGRATRLTPTKNWDKNAFAPSWSPDGTQLAFVCPGDGWRYHNGSHGICVVDASGTNLRNIPISDPTYIYPPAWFNERYVLFAGYFSDTNNTIYVADILDNIFRVFDPVNIPSAGVDMPSLVTDVNGEMILIYRYNDPVSGYILRYANVDTSAKFQVGGMVAPWEDINGTPDYPYHVDVTYLDGGTRELFAENIDYYSPAYNRAAIMVSQNAGQEFSVAEMDGGWTEPTWLKPQSYNAFGQTANPQWNGDPGSPSDLFALRTTVDWVP